jgi:hypothetical protein
MILQAIIDGLLLGLIISCISASFYIGWHYNDAWMTNKLPSPTWKQILLVDTVGILGFIAVVCVLLFGALLYLISWVSYDIVGQGFKWLFDFLGRTTKDEKK